METLCRIRSALRHETSRIRPATGAATPTGHSAATGGEESVGCGARRERIREFGVPMGPVVPKKGAEGGTPAPYPRPSAQALRVAEEAPDHVAPEGPPDSWLSDRSLDRTARWPDNPTAVGRGLPSLPCLEATAQFGLELSET